MICPEHQRTERHSDWPLNTTRSPTRPIAQRLMHAVLVLVGTSVRPEAIAAPGWLLAVSAIGGHANGAIDKPRLRLEQVRYFHGQMSNAAQSASLTSIRPSIENPSKNARGS